MEAVVPRKGRPFQVHNDDERFVGAVFALLPSCVGQMANHPSFDINLAVSSSTIFAVRRRELITRMMPTTQDIIG